MLVVGLMTIGHGAWAFSCSDVTEIPNTECEALVALYDSTDGDNWIVNTDWNVTNTPCSWYGIACSGKHVVTVSLRANKLTGTVPAEIGNLTNLHTLYIDRNQLTSLPPEIGNLANLSTFYVYNNQLSSLPTEIGNLAKLHTFYVYSKNSINRI